MTAKAKRAKRITKVQELTARVESLGKQLLEVQNSYVEATRKLNVEREIGRIRVTGLQEQHKAVVAFQVRTIHRLLGYVEPTVGETYQKLADETPRSWLDKVR